MLLHKKKRYIVFMNQDKKDLRYKRLKFLFTFLKLTVLGVILIGIPLYIIFVHPEIINRVSSVEKVKSLFEQHPNSSIFLYLLAQITQIVICVIPGQWLQIGAGIAWGFWIGYFLSILGAFLGSALTYYLARWLGKDALHLIFGEKNVEQYKEHLNSKKALIIIFLVFLIPGLPKDLCSYVAGISEIKFKPFLIVSLVGRTPGIMGSLLFGTQLLKKGYTGAIIIGIVAIMLFALGIVFHKKIIAWSDKAYDKLMNI